MQKPIHVSKFFTKTDVEEHAPWMRPVSHRLIYVNNVYLKVFS